MESNIKAEIKKTKQLKEYAKTSLYISIIILIIQILLVVVNGPYYGSVFEKLKQFYCDKTIYLKVRAIPLFVVINVFGYFYNFIKLKKLTKK